MANEVHGSLSHLQLYDETTWGTKPGSPTYVVVPVTEYGVKFQPNARQSKPYTGIFDQRHQRRSNGMPQGNLSALLNGHWVDWDGTAVDGSLAEYLTNWGFGIGQENGIWLPSKGAEWAEGPNVANVGHYGLRATQATLQGSADSGAFDFSMDLMGKSEIAVATVQTVPDDWEKLGDFEFADSTFTIDSTDTEITNVSLSINNGLTPIYVNGPTPSLLPRGQRVIQLSFTLIKNSDTYHLAARTLSAETEYDIQLVIKGLHNGTGATGTYSQCSFDMPRCSLTNPDDARDIGNLTRTTVNCMVLKPDTSEEALTPTWSLT